MTREPLATQPPSRPVYRLDAADREGLASYLHQQLMRRLIGVAQLPLRADLATKRRLLGLSRQLLLGL